MHIDDGENPPILHIDDEENWTARLDEAIVETQDANPAPIDLDAPLAELGIWTEAELLEQHMLYTICQNNAPDSYPPASQDPYM